MPDLGVKIAKLLLFLDETKLADWALRNRESTENQHLRSLQSDLRRISADALQNLGRGGSPANMRGGGLRRRAALQRRFSEFDDVTRCLRRRSGCAPTVERVFVARSRARALTPPHFRRRLRVGTAHVCKSKMTAHATESAVATPAFVRLLNFLFRRLGLFVADHDKFVLAGNRRSKG
ncbi:hypothetical protein ANCCEY_14164 [Ancylostoma ceylanicum]|uniref:Uncharacterized protein n=1 Tax=Ancylostoma ceylanicum TaxID=53326 RepID=A0A0D6L5I8_9BILA|nr:hypothetical protein ANCCEY_14164 [Ancylostoma ceylanicum]